MSRPVKLKHLQAARTAVGSSAAHAGSLATVASAAGGIALAAAATSVAAAVRLSLAVGGVPDRRAPARPRQRRASLPRPSSRGHPRARLSAAEQGRQHGKRQKLDGKSERAHPAPNEFSPQKS